MLLELAVQQHHGRRRAIIQSKDIPSLRSQCLARARGSELVQSERVQHVTGPDPFGFSLSLALIALALRKGTFPYFKHQPISPSRPLTGHLFFLGAPDAVQFPSAPLTSS
jgi:hypothetical protein